MSSHTFLIPITLSNKLAAFAIGVAVMLSSSFALADDNPLEGDVRYRAGILDDLDILLGDAIFQSKTGVCKTIWTDDKVADAATDNGENGEDNALCKRVLHRIFRAMGYRNSTNNDLMGYKNNALSTYYDYLPAIVRAFHVDMGINISNGEGTTRVDQDTKIAIIAALKAGWHCGMVNPDTNEKTESVKKGLCDALPDGWAAGGDSPSETYVTDLNVSEYCNAEYPYSHGASHLLDHMSVVDALKAGANANFFSGSEILKVAKEYKLTTPNAGATTAGATAAGGAKAAGATGATGAAIWLIAKFLIDSSIEFLKSIEALEGWGCRTSPVDVLSPNRRIAVEDVCIWALTPRSDSNNNDKPMKSMYMEAHNGIWEKAGSFTWTCHYNAPLDPNVDKYDLWHDIDRPEHSSTSSNWCIDQCRTQSPGNQKCNRHYTEAIFDSKTQKFSCTGEAMKKIVEITVDELCKNKHTADESKMQETTHFGDIEVKYNTVRGAVINGHPVCQGRTEGDGEFAKPK